MLLPGGLADRDTLERAVTLGPITGRVELALFGRGQPGSVPGRVTDTLELSVARVGSRPFTREDALQLTTGDRRWLLRQILIALGRGSFWKSVRCPGCDQPFDVLLEHDQLPTLGAGPEYPTSEVVVGAVSYVVRPPTGADEEHIADLPADADPASTLLDLCCDPPITDPAHRRPVEEVIEAQGPGVVTHVDTACPECGMSAAVDVDPYSEVGSGEGELVQDIHRLASTYHWSEPDILDLPVTRRWQYLELADRTRGLVT